MQGVITTVGHTPIPGGAGFAGYSGVRMVPRRKSPFGGFAGSADLVSIANRALERLQAAADTAQAACDARGGVQGVFDWITGSTATSSICTGAAQLQTNHDSFQTTINDASTTDETIVQILQDINKETDISDLLDLAKSTSAGHVLTQATVNAPGTVVGWAGDVGGAVGGGIIGSIPWWVWAAGGLYVAFELGYIGRKAH